MTVKRFALCGMLAPIVFALALAVFSLGVIATPVWRLSVSTSGTSAVDALSSTVVLGGYYLLMVAALVRIRDRNLEWQSVADRLSDVDPPSRFTVVAVLVLVSVFLAARWTYLDLDVLGDDVLDVTLAVVATLAAVARTVLASVETTRLRDRSQVDSVTGVFNRRSFREQCEESLAAWRRHGGAFSLIVLDLDDFARVNATLGHAEGDAVLTLVAQALSATVGRGGSVYRLSGDGFAVMVHAGGPVALALANSMLAEIGAIDLGPALTLSASIGVVDSVHLQPQLARAVLASGAVSELALIDIARRDARPGSCPPGRIGLRDHGRAGRERAQRIALAVAESQQHFHTVQPPVHTRGRRRPGHRIVHLPLRLCQPAAIEARDQKLAVEIQPIAVVRLDADATHAGRRDGECSRPAHRVPVERNAAAGRVERPAEVDSRIVAHQPRRPLEPIVVEVHAVQTPDRLSAVGVRQPLGGDDDGRARDSAGSGCIAHRCRADLLSNAIENRDLLDAGSAVATQPGFYRVDADHGDRSQRSREWKRTAVVLEERDRRTRRLEGKRTMRGVAVPVRCAVRIDVRMLEQSELDFDLKNWANGIVDLLGGDSARTDFSGQIF